MVKEKNIPKATHAGVLKLNNTELPCFVLEDGTRILSSRGFCEGLGRSYYGQPKQLGRKLPSFLGANNLKPFIGKDLSLGGNLVVFKTPSGPVSHGVLADDIPKICQVWIDADRAGVLRNDQKRTADKAYVLLAGFAHVGIRRSFLASHWLGFR